MPNTKLIFFSQNIIISDGGGRTGCYLGIFSKLEFLININIKINLFFYSIYLAIDANLEYAKEDNMYDVFSYAKKLRSQRSNLIEGVDQYKFIYECLEEAHKSGKSWFPVSELQVKMKFKSIRDPVTKINEYQREYEKILKVTPKFSIGDCAGGHRVEVCIYMNNSMNSKFYKLLQTHLNLIFFFFFFKSNRIDLKIEMF